MAFAGYLSTAEINNLVQKAVSSGLVTVDRTLLLQGIFAPFALGLKKSNNDLDQFQLDLVKLNTTERLSDGQIPLVQFLRNAADYLRLRGLPEAEDFERVANAIGNRTAGVPAMPDPAQLREVIHNEAIVGVDDMVDFQFLASGVTVGRSVARISVPRFENGAPVQAANGGPWIMLGTAWVIAPTLVFTNHHVIAARQSNEAPPSANDVALQAAGSIVEFDFDSSGAVTQSVQVLRVEASSPGLDYAVLRLAQPANRQALVFNPQPVVFGPASYLPLNIIHHPRGLPKRVAIRNNLLTGADNETIRYFTDTDSGSSGSPVCDDNWRVVALHRGGKFVNNVSFQGKPTAYVNYGSQIQAILQDLEAQNHGLRQEIV
ncbi:MAG TPA: trypsin-like peptidase domain-containing protein [Pyrinomonadaceae bacterium]|nr:trypsin-like peptidase domain-containing protein [Pyrinomonadaceae bacterium]